MRYIDLVMLEAEATYFERAARDQRDRQNGESPTFNVVWPPSIGYLDGAARDIRAAVAELRRLGVESKGNG